MSSELNSILKYFDIKPGTPVADKTSILAEKFSEMELPVSKSLTGVLELILKNTQEPEDICSNLDFTNELASHPSMGKKDELFQNSIPSGNPGLQDFIFALIRHQILEKRIDAGSLSKVQSKILKGDSAEFTIYCNASRVRSSTVVHNKNEYIDSCPICIQELKKSNKKVWFWRDYYLFGNHAPIVSNHLMVTYKKHGAQTMDRQFIEDIIDLNSVFDNARPYFNRPGSLDKHRHVQAFSGKFPIEDIKTVPIGRTGISEFDPAYPATGFVVEGKDKKKVALLVEKIMNICDKQQKKDSEQYIPFYLVFARRKDTARIFIFPKLKWKADTFPKDMAAYNDTPDDLKKEFVIIPASVETAGRGSTSDLSTFNRITHEDYCHILENTSIPKVGLQFVKEALLNH